MRGTLRALLVVGLVAVAGAAHGVDAPSHAQASASADKALRAPALEADCGCVRVAHAYDTVGRLSWLGYGVEGGTTALLYEPLELTAAGSPVWERLGNGVGTYFERDVLEQVTAMSVRDTGLTSGSVSAYQAAFASAAAGDIRYELDSITRTAYGAATVVVDSSVAPGNPRRDAVFGYDGAARLVSATLGETFDGSTSLGSYGFAYAYDGLQNLVQREAVALPTGAAAPRMASGAYEHGGSGYGPRQLAGVPSASVTMSYDGAGRMVGRTGGGFGAAMAYDAADRVRRVTLGDAEVRHRYGPSGERNWTGWFDDDTLEREEYRFASGLALRNGRYELVVGLGGSRSLARISVPQTADTTHEVTYMHPGVGPGAVTFTDKAGALVEERLHEPFGVTLGALADYEQEPLGWNAKPVDPWTEWSDHGARWHATDLAHWLSPDPLLRGPDVDLLGEFWRLSPYGFVAGNPVAFWDPDGLNPAAALPRIVPALANAAREVMRGVRAALGSAGLAIAGATGADAGLRDLVRSAHIAGGLGVAVAVQDLQQARLEASCDWCWALASKSEDATQQDEGAESPEAASTTEERNPAQDKRLTAGDVKRLEQGGEHPHRLKPRKHGARWDLFKDRDGNIYVKPKDGTGPGDPTGLNINDF